MKIVVIGGNGLVGRNIVQRLRVQGHEVIAASRSTGVDLVTGHGLSECLAGAEVVVDASNSPNFDDEAAFDFFRSTIVNLLGAELAAGVSHHVTVSIVGTDRLTSSPYLRGKAFQDRMIRASGIPFTIVHATQFYEFLVAIIDSAIRNETVHLPPAYIQPVASDDVAALMAELAVGEPLNGAIEIAGPERERMSELIQRFVLDMEAPCEVRTDARALYFGALLEEDSLVPRNEARRGAIGFQRWLERSEFARAGW